MLIPHEDHVQVTIVSRQDRYTLCILYYLIDFLKVFSTYFDASTTSEKSWILTTLSESYCRWRNLRYGASCVSYKKQKTLKELSYSENFRLLFFAIKILDASMISSERFLKLSYFLFKKFYLYLIIYYSVTESGQYILYIKHIPLMTATKLLTNLLFF